VIRESDPNENTVNADHRADSSAGPSDGLVPRLAVIGDYNIDVILGEVTHLPRVGYDTVSPEYSIEPGGSAAIVALGLARAGWDVDLYANVGNDLFGHYLRDTSKSAGVRLMNCADDRSESTGLSVAFSKHGDRGFVSVPNPISDWGALDLLLEDPPQHVHVCYHPYLPQLTERLATILPQLKAKGTTLSLDPAGPGPEREPTMERVLAVGKVDFLMVNTQETQDLGLSIPPEQQDLETAASTIVVKRGDKGSEAWTHGQHLEVRERQVDAIESTGAGDNFAVGFLTSWLRKRDLETALRAGNLFGSESTRYPGGVRAQANYPDLMRDHADLFESATGS